MQSPLSTQEECYINTTIKVLLGISLQLSDAVLTFVAL